MKIRVNGDEVQEQKSGDGATLKSIMGDMSRYLAEREQVVADVEVNGREVPDWDVSTVAVGATDEIDIHTMATNDYAVMSLGDVGDYAGNALGVIRNVEAVCAKDGFEAVRASLTEGIEYILHVITTAGRILHMNFKDSRYDMRTGDQMMKEMESLKQKISSARRLEDAKETLTALEFTLTDWLKYLETLLRRYADQQAEVGSAEEILEDARTQSASLERLQTDVKTIVNDFYAGRAGKSIEALPERITVLQAALTFIQRLRKFGIVRYPELEVESERLSDKIPKLSKTLQELSDAIQVGDTVMMRDVLEYEILPFIDYLRKIVSQISATPPAA
jgi:hypothetical protein